MEAKSDRGGGKIEETKMIRINNGIPKTAREKRIYRQGFTTGVNHNTQSIKDSTHHAFLAWDKVMNTRIQLKNTMELAKKLQASIEMSMKGWE